MSDDEDSESSSEPEEKKTTKARKKDAGPKRPRTAFVCFSSERRPILKKENPGMSFGELGKLVGKEWHELGPSERKPYEKLAAEDKQRFVDAGGAPKTHTKAKESKPEKQPKKKDGVKKPRSAFVFYSQEMRAILKAADPGLSFGDLGKEVGRKWKEATDAEKDKFQQMAIKDKARFNAEKGDSSSENKKAAPAKRKAKKEVSEEEESSEDESESEEEA